MGNMPVFKNLAGEHCDLGMSALSTELRRHIHPAAGFEPSTTRLIGEVTHVFTTGKNR
jgi:hypothetical protein